MYSLCLSILLSYTHYYLLYAHTHGLSIRYLPITIRLVRLPGFHTSYSSLILIYTFLYRASFFFTFIFSIYVKSYLIYWTLSIHLFQIYTLVFPNVHNHTYSHSVSHMSTHSFCIHTFHVNTHVGCVRLSLSLSDSHLIVLCVPSPYRFHMWILFVTLFTFINDHLRAIPIYDYYISMYTHLCLYHP
jgi:hypothetical protein